MSVTRRSLKTGSDWNFTDLSFLNITLEARQGIQFFGRQPSPIQNVDPDILVPIDQSIDPRMSKEVVSFLLNLQLAYYGGGELNQRSAQLELVTMIFQIMGYDDYPVVICMNFDIPFLNWGTTVVSTTDIALYDCINGLILLVFRIASRADGNHMPQIIADAIAAFEHNNRKRVKYGLPPLNEMIIPCITMLRTRPIFYRVPVTINLGDAVKNGQKANEQTLVTFCLPPLSSFAMDAPQYRQTALEYYKAFRGVVEEFREKMIA